MMKTIGKTFADELKAAGLLGLPFSWGDDGEIAFGDSMSQAQRDAVMAVYQAHDPEAVQPIDPDQIVALYMAAIQKALDAGAQSWGYDDLRAAVSYVGDPYPRFNAEAVALRGWRSAVWVWAGMEEAAIKAGQKALPTPVEQFVAQMPAMPARPV